MSSTVVNPVQWTPKITNQSHQSNESYQEQLNVLSQLVDAVKLFRSGVYSFIRHQVIVGPPGTGKSFLLFNCVAYALCQGLNSMITSLAAERSASLNGKHINALIPFPVEVASTCESLARNALSRLQRDPVRSRYLENLDVLFVEEVSMISSELWAAIDHVLQTICSNYVPFEGKLIIASGDFFQLPSPSGSSLISSSFVLTTFQFLKLQFFVRMQNIAGQMLLRLIGDVPRSDDATEEAWKIMSEECHFVDPWEDALDTDIRIFFTRKAEQEAVSRKIEEVQSSGVAFQYVNCIDEMCTSSTNHWIAASNTVTSYLNRFSLLPQRSFLYVGAIMRLTINMPDLQVFQGQLCVVVDISQFDSCGFVSVALAPPGCRQIPDFNSLIALWTIIRLKRTTSPVSKYNFRTACRRTQLPLKLFVASTIHKTMGETLPKTATQIVGSSHYKLWMSEQLYVIASRVRDLFDITFVGNKVEVGQAVKEVLQKYSHWAALTNAIMNSLTAPNVVVSQFLSNPFPSASVPTPDTPVGYCYLLQSAPLSELLYIGSTVTLKRRLREHNSGHGSVFTNVVSRRPWILVAFVTGFSPKEITESFRNFEKIWIQRLKQIRSLEKKNVTVQQALKAARDIILAWRTVHSQLTLVSCSI